MARDRDSGRNVSSLHRKFFACASSSKTCTLRYIYMHGEISSKNSFENEFESIKLKIK